MEYVCLKNCSFLLVYFGMLKGIQIHYFDVNNWMKSHLLLAFLFLHVHDYVLNSFTTKTCTCWINFIKILSSEGNKAIKASDLLNHAKLQFNDQFNSWVTLQNIKYYWLLTVQTVNVLDNGIGQFTTTVH